jgi:hypothetical protein
MSFISIYLLVSVSVHRTVVTRHPFEGPLTVSVVYICTCNNMVVSVYNRDEVTSKPDMERYVPFTLYQYDRTITVWVSVPQNLNVAITFLLTKRHPMVYPYG